VRLVRPTKGDEVPDEKEAKRELEVDNCEDVARLPWIRKAPHGVPHVDNDAKTGLAPARMEAHPAGYLIPSKVRRAAIANCPVPGQDGRRRPQSRAGRPLTHKFLDSKIKVECHQASAARTAEALDAAIQEFNAEEQARAASCPPGYDEGPSYVGSEIRGQMRGVAPGGMTQVAEQQLLSPGGELLNVYGAPRSTEAHASPEKFAATHQHLIAEYRDGSASGPICHQRRGHLGGIPRGHGTVMASTGLGMSIPLHTPKGLAAARQQQRHRDRDPSRKTTPRSLSAADVEGGAVDGTERSTPWVASQQANTPPQYAVGALDEVAKYKWLASVSPFPRGFASTGTYKLVSSSPHGAELLGSRSDQGGSSLGCLQTKGRFTGLDRAAKNWDGMPPRRVEPPAGLGRSGHQPTAQQSTAGNSIRLVNQGSAAPQGWKTPTNTFDRWE